MEGNFYDTKTSNIYHLQKSPPPSPLGKNQEVMKTCAYYIYGSFILKPWSCNHSLYYYYNHLIPISEETFILNELPIFTIYKRALPSGEEEMKTRNYHNIYGLLFTLTPWSCNHSLYYYYNHLIPIWEETFIPKHFQYLPFIKVPPPPYSLPTIIIIKSIAFL